MPRTAWVVEPRPDRPHGRSNRLRPMEFDDGAARRRDQVGVLDMRKNLSPQLPDNRAFCDSPVARPVALSGRWHRPGGLGCYRTTGSDDSLVTTATTTSQTIEARRKA